MRNTFIEHLLAKAEADARVFLVVGDLGFSVVEPFVARFPDRFLNAGVAEQNMTSVAAGLAREGYRVFTYSIANFSTTRCLEQIRVDVCYHDLPVCVVAVGGGFMYGSLGPTHHATEDIALMRVLPGMRVYVPFSKAATREAVDQVLAGHGPAYLRLGREDVAVDVVDPAGLTYVRRAGGRVLYLVAGQISSAMLAAAEAEGADVAALLCVKPLPEEALHAALGAYAKVVVWEDHQREGGVFGAVAELASAVESCSIQGRFSPYAAKEAEQRRRMMERRTNP